MLLLKRSLVVVRVVVVVISGEDVEGDGRSTAEDDGIN